MPKTVSLGSLIRFMVLAYAWGWMTVVLDLFPFPQVTTAFIEVYDFAKHWRNDLGFEPDRYLVPSRPPAGDRIAIVPERVMPGLRVVAGYFDGRASQHGAVLLDDSGAELFFWPIDTDAIAANMGRHTFLHGVDVLEDGSLVVNFDEGRVLARIDACGKVMWSIPGEYHHAVSMQPDGTLWTAGAELSQHAVSRIDPATGVVQFSVYIEDLLDGPARGVLQIRRQDAEFDPGWLPDPFHLNDVEVLGPEMAGAFPLFEAGDVMISLRSLNLVAVFDAKLRTMRWWQNGPWHRQHDSDFLPNGKISVYDNNSNGEGSRILEINPVTRQVDVRYQGTENAPFYTWIRGKHQTLPNGNVLITEPQSGRAFEVDTGGRIVWEYQNRYDAERNLLVSKAMWLPQGFLKGDLPVCVD